MWRVVSGKLVIRIGGLHLLCEKCGKVVVDLVAEVVFVLSGGAIVCVCGVGITSNAHA